MLHAEDELEKKKGPAEQNSDRALPGAIEGVRSAAFLQLGLSPSCHTP